MTRFFPCNQCGACCKSIRLSKITNWLDRGDGVCKYFDENQNTCTIYDNRPEVCNVQKMYEKHYAKQFSWDDFVILNQTSCEVLLKQVEEK